MKLMPSKKKRPLLTLQLTAMIDIFALIVIFLVKGTVFGVADVEVPNGMKLPASVSKESVEAAPRIVIAGNRVAVSALGEDFPLELFRPGGGDQQKLSQLKTRLKAFIAKLPGEARTSGSLLNVVADRGTSYQDIFDSIRFFRECGFETLLFVATGESQP